MPILRVLTAFLVWAPLTLGAETSKLSTLNGAQLEGDLVSVSDKEIVLTVKGMPTATPTPSVLQLDLGRAPAPPAGRYSDVELTDGTLLHCTQFAVKGTQVELKLAGGQEIKLPLGLVASYLREADDAKTRAEWQELASKKTNRDLLAVKDAAGKVNALEGTFGDGDDKGEAIEFETSTGLKRRLALGRIHAMSFFRKPDPDAPAALCKVVDTSNDLLMAAKVELGSAGFTVTTVAGARMEFPRDVLARLDYSKGKLQYLSDVEPGRVTDTSGLVRFDSYRRDKNLLDAPLRLVDVDKTGVKDRTFAKGLCILGYTELVYDIGGNYKDFKAVLGIDDGARPETRAKIVIEGDGKELFTAEVKSNDRPRPVTLDVKSVKLLRIVVTPFNLLDLDDHVTLADAKVSK